MTDIVAFARDELGWTPFGPQVGMLDDIADPSIRIHVWRCGRRSGKNLLASTAAVWAATVLAPELRAEVLPEELVEIVVISRNTTLARRTHRVILGFLRRLERAGDVDLIDRDTAEEIELLNGVLIRIAPCHAAGARGPAVAVAILDEIAWWVGRDGSPLDPSEIFAGVVPATAQFTAGKTICLSTPRWGSDFFATLCEQAESDRFPQMRHVHATTEEMNPKIDLALLAQERDRDPEMFAREYLAEFAAGVGAVFPAEAVRAAVRAEPEVRGPDPRFGYVVAVDAAYVGDRFAVAVGHLELVGPSDGRVIVDLVASWRGTRKDPVPFDPTLDAVAELARAYGAPVVIDQYAAQPIRQSLARRGVTVVERPWSSQSKVDAVGAVRKALYASALELPPSTELVAEMTALEQRPTPGGRPRIAAPGGGHDDLVSAVMAVTAELVIAGVATEQYFDPEIFNRLVAMGAGEATANRLAWVDEMPAMPSISSI